MRTFETRRRERGFSYLLLLFALLLGAAALAATGERWQVALQREREDELLFRGAEIRSAIETYHARQVAGANEFPPRLEDLVEDAREGEVRHHLRRLYLDPFTGAADWRLLRRADDRIVGVRSRSTRVAMRTKGLPPTADHRADDGSERALQVGDWLFVAAGAENVSP